MNIAILVECKKITRYVLIRIAYIYTVRKKTLAVKNFGEWTLLQKNFGEWNLLQIWQKNFYQCASAIDKMEAWHARAIQVETSVNPSSKWLHTTILEMDAPF